MDTPTRATEVSGFDSILSENFSTPSKDANTEGLVHRHSKLKVATEKGTLNPVKEANVLFDGPSHDTITRLKNSTVSFNLDDATGNNVPPSRPKWEFLDNPMIPYVISLYLQLVINVLVLLLVVYYGYKLVLNIQRDIKIKEQQYIMDIIDEVSRCTQDFYRNKCADNPPPAIRDACSELNLCMNQDPRQVSRSMITAATFADIVNGFFSAITWKALIFSTFGVVGFLAMSNTILGRYRSNSIYTDATVKDLQASLRAKDALIKSYEDRLSRLESTGTLNLLE